jgi:NTP pyrophosphatase (non-canonical NTP hydrolase)
MTNHSQQQITFEDINQRIWKHLEERDWHRSPSRGVATSIALEASELLEHYQWSDSPVGTKEDLAAELADILIYAFQFAQLESIDIVAAISHKLQVSAQKYPAANFKGKDPATMRQVWLDAKLKHHKEGL